MQLAASHFQLGPAVLAGAGAGHGATERLRHRLEAVADAEHRDTQVEQRGVQLGSTVGVHTGGSTGEHDRLRVLRLDLLDTGGVRDDLGIHPRLPHPPGDELRVLRSEVDHEHWTLRGGLRFHPPSLEAAVA